MRNEIAKQFIKGRGLEIGAFHNPWPIPPGAQVVYCDQNCADWVIKKYNWKGDPSRVVRPDFIDNAQDLYDVPDNTFDFVIGSHVLEHCISPLTALTNHARVLKQGGVIIHAIPERTQTFDSSRSNATLECLIRDDIDSGYDNMMNHYADYFRHVDKIPENELEQRCKSAYYAKEDVHFHAWDQHVMRVMIDYACHKNNLHLELFKFVGHEVFVVMRKL